MVGSYDGCQDGHPEDIDDDNDGIFDINDACPFTSTSLGSGGFRTMVLIVMVMVAEMPVKI